MNKIYTEIHPSFKLNKLSFNFDDLKEVGYCLIKEGLPHEIPSGNFLIDWVNDSEFIYVKTSGSTGTPKQIKLQKKNMVNSAIATGGYFNLKAGDSALLSLPADFIAGKMMLVRAMVLGLKLDYFAPNSNPLLGITKSYDFAAMIPLQVENSMKNIEVIKTLIVGGAKMPVSLINRLRKKSTRIFETYGMTETITHIAVKEINKLQNSVTENFKALPEVTFKTDKRNCLVIHTPNISDDKVVTNDLVDLISETEFQWLGRYDSIINSGGIKLIPEKIENKLSEIIKHDYFVVGLPDKKLGEKLVLIIESGKKDETILQSIQQLKTLDKFEIPKEVIFIKQFDRTSNGKIQRNKTVEHLNR